MWTDCFYAVAEDLGDEYHECGFFEKYGSEGTLSMTLPVPPGTWHVVATLDDGSCAQSQTETISRWPDQLDWAVTEFPGTSAADDDSVCEGGKDGG